jgi:hypothetical protein
MPADEDNSQINLVAKENRAFITVHNSMRIVKMIEPDKLSSLQGEVYDRVLPLFSKKEKDRLLGIQELLKDPVLFIDRYYDPARVPKDTGQFVRPEMSPAYHCTTDCPRLHADYKNYRIPYDVYRQGFGKISEFRKWFQEHAELLEKDKPSFIGEMSVTFGIKRAAVEEVAAPNTGCEPFANLSLPELKNKIESLLNAADEYCESSPMHTRILGEFMVKTWLAYKDEPIKYNKTGYPDNEIRQLLMEFVRNFKTPVQRALVEYYRVKFNPDVSFQGRLLDRLGFVPCKTCGSHSW